MRHKYLLLVFTLLTSFGSATVSAAIFSQDTIFNQRDNSYRKQGFWRKKYPNGKLAYKGYFKDDKPRGIFTRYHEDGTLLAEMVFNNTGNKAQVKLYYSGGYKVAAEGAYLNEKKDSTWKYFAPDKRLVFQENYKNGIKHGDYITYYKSGAVYEVIPYVNGEIEGDMRQYYPNGQIKTEWTLLNGKQNGKIRSYFSDGTVRVEGNYKDGIKHGIWSIYNMDRKMVKQTQYINGFPKNREEEMERETREIEEMLKNAGQISEPDVQSFFERTGGF